MSARLTSIVCALLGLALTAPMLGFDFTNWDDLAWVVNSPVASQGFAGIPLAFTTPIGSAWYPVTHVVYCVLFGLFGASPLAFHLAQWLCWAAALAVLPWAFRAVGLSARAGLLASVWWLVHPLRVESYAWVANLKDTLSLFFVLAAVALQPKRRGLSTLAWCLALLSKATVFPLAVLFVFLEWPSGRRSSPLLRYGLPALAVAVVAAMIHLPSAASMDRTWPGGSLVAALPSALFLPWQYLGWLLWPHGSQALYDFTPVQWLEWRGLLGLVAWGLTVAAALRLRTRAGWCGLLAWALPFAPVTGLVPLAFPVADRYALLPSLAVAALVGVGLTRLSRWASLGALVVLSLPLAVLAERRLPAWHDSVSLWEADRGHSHLKASHINLAGALGGVGRFNDAARELDLAVRLWPADVTLLSHEVFALAARDGLPEPRIALYLQSIQASHGDARALLQLGLVARDDGQRAVAQAIATWLSGAGAIAQAQQLK